jgi:secreted Zn-dependent insulinase-like peptidase
MGSEKYPSETEFTDYIGAHGGSSNAFTEFEYTNYQFKVDYSGLQKALDLQANLFAGPLLAQDAMEREIKAVESEF